MLPLPREPCPTLRCETPDLRASPAVSRHSFSSTQTRSLYSPSANHTLTHWHSYIHFPTPSPSYQASSVPPSWPTPSYTPPSYLLPPSDASLGHKKLAVVIFATIGGVIGFVSLALFTRQAIAYFRSPRHNVAMTAVEREQLVLEMARYTGTTRRRSVPPPPPYERPPSYRW